MSTTRTIFVFSQATQRRLLQRKIALLTHLFPQPCKNNVSAPDGPVLFGVTVCPKKIQCLRYHSILFIGNDQSSSLRPTVAQPAQAIAGPNSK